MKEYLHFQGSLESSTKARAREVKKLTAMESSLKNRLLPWCLYKVEGKIETVCQALKRF